MFQLGRDNLHSTLVVWAKILLPLAALAVLSTLFMVSHRVDPTDAIPYAQVDVADRMREPRLTDASFAGVTEDGTTLQLAAGSARPAGTDGNGGASDLSGTIETPDGVATTLTAGEARLDPSGETVDLSGGVTLSSSTGYGISTDALTLALDRTRLETRAPVTAQAPMGRISADGMILQRNAAGRYDLLFTGRVRLLYQP